ncbi:hypothetical protein F506_05690 [Herbaspirillum hiltneri N3]|uniref:Uncharacterized protein n=1 Tax=Herbaspirillum hiltneri N3 TaxID=1262470 RepID=A0ABN4HW47_9BURK|nr:hypothetical protein F506_05690 [Herbaspirillum hiltneri N3]
MISSVRHKWIRATKKNQFREARNHENQGHAQHAGGSRRHCHHQQCRRAGRRQPEEIHRRQHRTRPQGRQADRARGADPARPPRSRDGKGGRHNPRVGDRTKNRRDPEEGARRQAGEAGESRQEEEQGARQAIDQSAFQARGAESACSKGQAGRPAAPCGRGEGAAGQNGERERPRCHQKSRTGPQNCGEIYQVIPEWISGARRLNYVNANRNPGVTAQTGRMSERIRRIDRET